MNKGAIVTLFDLQKWAFHEIDDRIQKLHLRWNRGIPPAPRLLYLGWKLNYRQNVSNTHHCPKNGEINWGGRKKDAPRGYPGWEGRVWLGYSKRSERLNTMDAARDVLHTGTGGGGMYDFPFHPGLSFNSKEHKYSYQDTKTRVVVPVHPYSWDGRVFIDDHPEYRTQRLLESNEIELSSGCLHERTYEGTILGRGS